MAYQPGKAWPHIRAMIKGEPYDRRTWAMFADPKKKGLSPNMRLTGWVGEAGHQKGAEREKYVELLEHYFASILPPAGTLDGGELMGYQPLHVGGNLATIAIARFIGARRLQELAERAWRARLALYSLGAAPVGSTYVVCLPGVRTGTPGSAGKLLPEGHRACSPIVSRTLQLSFGLPLRQFLPGGAFKDAPGAEGESEQFGLDLNQLALQLGFRGMDYQPQMCRDLRTRWPIVVVRGEGGMASWFVGQVSGYHDNPRLAAASWGEGVRGLRANGIAGKDFAVWGGWCEATPRLVGGAVYGLDYKFFVKQSPKLEPVLQAGIWLMWATTTPEAIVLITPDAPPRPLGSLGEVADTKEKPMPKLPPPPSAPPATDDRYDAYREELLSAAKRWGRPGGPSTADLLGLLNKAAQEGLA